MNHLRGLALLLLTGCTVTLPEPIYTGDTTQGFAHIVSGNEEQTSPQLAIQQAQLNNDAASCGARLNGHRNAAQNFTGLRVVLTGLGGLAGGAGGVVAALVPSGDQRQAAAVVAAIGGGVALLGTFISGLVGDPTDRLRRHAQASRSWDEARTLARRARNETDAGLRLSLINQADDALLRCRRDEAPLSEPPLPLSVRGPVLTQ